MNDRGCRECDRLFGVLVSAFGEIMTLEMQPPADGALQAAMGAKQLVKEAMLEHLPSRGTRESVKVRAVSLRVPQGRQARRLRAV